MAGPDDIKTTLNKSFPDLKIERITKAGYGDMYEIFAGGDIFYTDEKGTYLLLGKLIDLKTRQNITDNRLQKLTAIKFDDLPLDQAIKLTRGNGARRLAIFEDPNCGYCKRFEQDLNSLDNITAYIFPYAILSPDSGEKAKAIWCSTDRLKAWQDLMLRGKAPATAVASCEAPVEKIRELGQRLRVNGTPLTFFENGERVSGAIPKEQIEAKLVEVAAASPAKSAAK
ncbi:MAG: DsbC family protein [Betaproteobacteria bacterium]|nr:DsbC family protein [Betaproteobacteria bacterium]